jgi:hypothetical protein
MIQVHTAVLVLATSRDVIIEKVLSHLDRGGAVPDLFQ